MSDKLKGLIDAARRVEMTPEQREAQRISFAYGNTKFENDAITRESVVRASEGLRDRGTLGSVELVHATSMPGRSSNIKKKDSVSAEFSPGSLSVVMIELAAESD